MLKVSLSLFLLLACIQSYLFASESNFLDVKLGMKVNTFNRLKLANTKIPRQKRVKKKSSEGIFYAPTAIQSKFFKSKNSLWQHGMIKLQNNQVQQFSLFAKKVSNDKAHKAFSALTEVFGTSFSAHPFKSFGKSGVSFEWQVEDQIYSMSLVTETQGRWSYHLDVSPVIESSLNKPFLAVSSNEVKSIFMALGIDSLNHGQSLASKDEPLDDELSSLFD